MSSWFSLSIVITSGLVCPKCPGKTRPQAGVALGMALTAQQLADGAVVRSVVLFSVLVYELVGCPGSGTRYIPAR